MLAFLANPELRLLVETFQTIPRWWWFPRCYRQEIKLKQCSVVERRPHDDPTMWSEVTTFAIKSGRLHRLAHYTRTEQCSEASYPSELCDHQRVLCLRECPVAARRGNMCHHRIHQRRNCAVTTQLERSHTVVIKDLTDAIAVQHILGCYLAVLRADGSVAAIRLFMAYKGEPPTARERYSAPPPLTAFEW